MRKIVFCIFLFFSLPFIVNSQKVNNSNDLYNFIIKYSKICIDSIIENLNKRGDTYRNELFIINVVKLDINKKAISFSIGKTEYNGELKNINATNYTVINGRIIFIKSLNFCKELTNELEYPLIDKKMMNEVEKSLLNGFDQEENPLTLIVNYVDGKISWGYKVIKGVNCIDYSIVNYEFIKKLNDNHLIYYEPEMFKDTLVW